MIEPKEMVNRRNHHLETMEGLQQTLNKNYLQAKILMSLRSADTGKLKGILETVNTSEEQLLRATTNLIVMMMSLILLHQTKQNLNC